MRTAAKVAAHKEAHPELYCPEPRCLWRTGGGRCPRHERVTAFMHAVARFYPPERDVAAILFPGKPADEVKP